MKISTFYTQKNSFRGNYSRKYGSQSAYEVAFVILLSFFVNVQVQKNYHVKSIEFQLQLQKALAFCKLFRT